ncbi:MAG: FecR family protein [Nitrospirota bacterium]
MKIERLKSVLCGLLTAAIVSMGLALPSWAVDKAGDVVSVRGKAVIERKAGKIDARIKDALLESDSVVTRDKARVKMLFRDDSILTLGANSKLVIKKYLYSPESKRAESIYELADGRLRSVVGSSGFKVTTPTAFAAARGTVFTVSYNMETGATEITVLEGSVEVRNINAEIAGTEVVTAGQSSTVSGDKPPTTPKPADLTVGGVDDKGGLPGLGEGVEPEQHIIDDLHDQAEHSLKPGHQFEQEPAHAVTNVNMNVQFPK